MTHQPLSNDSTATNLQQNVKANGWPDTLLKIAITLTVFSLLLYGSFRVLLLFVHSHSEDWNKGMLAGLMWFGSLLTAAVGALLAGIVLIQSRGQRWITYVLLVLCISPNTLHWLLWHITH